MDKKDASENKNSHVRRKPGPSSAGSAASSRRSGAVKSSGSASVKRQNAGGKVQKKNTAKSGAPAGSSQVPRGTKLKAKGSYAVRRKSEMPKRSSYKRQKDILEGQDQPEETADYLDAQELDPPKKPPSPYVRKLKKFFLGFITIILLLGVCMILSFTVFFKIDTIKIEGKTRYKTEDIIKSSQINTGENLLLYNTGSAVKNIQNDFPYIETVDIEKRLFNSINIKVTEAVPNSILKSGGNYIVLSKSGKIVEIAGKKSYDVPMIIGAKISDAKLSAKVHFLDENLKRYLDKVLEAISDNNLKKDIATVDISDTSSIIITKKNGFKIVIGNFENVEYKIKTAAYILTHNVKDNASGTLDVSLASAESGKSYLHLGENYESSVQESSLSSKKEETSKSENSGTQEQSDTETTQTDEGEEPAEVYEQPDYTDDEPEYIPDETQYDYENYEEYTEE